MNRLIHRILAAAAMLTLVCTGALAREQMCVYVSPDAMEAPMAQRLAALLGSAFSQADWTMTQDGSLRELVMGDRAPDLAIGSPSQTREWAQAGLLAPLQTKITDQTRMEPQVLACCVEDETLFMAPLFARHRQMAVNVRQFEAHGLGYLLDKRTYPVWFPAQFYQILEEFLIEDCAAMDVWPADAGSGAAMEALVQAIFDRRLVSQDGAVQMENICAGVQWLSDMVDDGLIGLCESREEALDRFLAGETAIFIDWTEREEAAQRALLEKRGLTIAKTPYPASSALPVRSYELTGVSVFDSGSAQRTALALKAAVFLHESIQAQLLFGSRGIWRDDAVWLCDLSAAEQGATLRDQLYAALNAVLLEGETAAAALMRAQAAMDALR